MNHPPKAVQVLVLLALCLPVPFSACARGHQDTETAASPASVHPRTAGDFATKTKCSDRGEAYVTRERNIDIPSNGIRADVKNEQFTYSPRLDTCLAYFEVWEFGAGTTYNIVDTLTKKKLYITIAFLDRKQQAWWDSSCKPSEGCLNGEEFRKKRAELFDNVD